MASPRTSSVASPPTRHWTVPSAPRSAAAARPPAANLVSEPLRHHRRRFRQSGQAAPTVTSCRQAVRDGHRRGASNTASGPLSVAGGYSNNGQRSGPQPPSLDGNSNTASGTYFRRRRRLVKHCRRPRFRRPWRGVGQHGQRRPELRRRASAQEGDPGRAPSSGGPMAHNRRRDLTGREHVRPSAGPRAASGFRGRRAPTPSIAAEPLHREHPFDRCLSLERAGAWTNNSDRALKHGFRRVRPKSVLEKVVQMRDLELGLQGGETIPVRHIGPDGAGLSTPPSGSGSTTKHISTLDEGRGGAARLIQGLYRRGEPGARAPEPRARNPACAARARGRPG